MMDVNEIKIRRSRNRRKTVSARMVRGIMLVNAPAHMSESLLHDAVNKLKIRFEKKALRQRLNSTADLMTVAQQLNKKYFNGALSIAAIAYSTRQDKKYGVCNTTARHILISHRLAQMPVWVRDYVIVHELAHLVEPNHGPRFHALVSRYALAERAKGFLMAKGFEEEED